MEKTTCWIQSPPRIGACHLTVKPHSPPYSRALIPDACGQRPRLELVEQVMIPGRHVLGTPLPRYSHIHTRWGLVVRGIHSQDLDTPPPNTHTHTYTHTCMHTYTHRHRHTSTGTHTHTHRDKNIHMDIQIHTDTHTHTYIRGHRHRHSYSDI